MSGKEKTLTHTQKAKREKLLMALPKAIQRLEADLANLLYGDSRYTFECGIAELRRIHEAILQNGHRFDASIVPFFPGHPEYKKDHAFLRSEMIGLLSQFLNRGIQAIRLIFKNEGVELPRALAVLHEEYNNVKLHLPLQQHWFSSVYPGLGSMLAPQPAAALSEMT